ncbi:hypothetical protein S40285_07549 [Stachybotrys chlorohalonatus IBT 40285]|uniref:Microsomal glutathione S-transferase 3 n=1 Tax=Stachybotrys chlorohalonatus (strain IBT 40285) TaxID=1283841 RepID=A0A084QFP6_STAC4|nr:hypothetical protein S40285_07549 [Stachybotrys chlorohalonata IBT 40285]
MPFILELPDKYGLVLAVATSTFFLNTVHVVLTSNARRASGIKYPVAYASNEVAEKDRKAYLFNCAQRAHANFTENQTSFLGALLIAGLQWPVASAALGGCWALSRLVYAIGYARSGPEGRTRGSMGSFLFDSSLKLMAAYVAFSFATQK